MNNTFRLLVPGGFFAGLILLACSAMAQTTLTLEAALRQAFDQSVSARTAREELRASEAAAEAARRALYSTVDLSVDVPSYSRTLNAQYNIETRRYEFFPMEMLQWTGRLDVSQPIIWTNSTITLSGLLYRQDQKDDSPGGSFYRDFYTDLAVQLRQPLFVPNSQRIALRRARINYEEALADYLRSTLELRYMVTERFYQLYAAQERVMIQEDRVRQETESFTTGQRKYRAGLIAEVEALQFEVDQAAAQNDLLSAYNRLAAQANSFKQLIGVPLEDSLHLLLSDTTITTVYVDEAEAIGMAKRTRVDLQRAHNNVERGELSLDEIEGQRSIRGDLFLSYGLNNNDQRLSTLYNDLRDTRRATFTITLPIFDWGKHSRDVEAAEARLRIARLASEDLETTIEREIKELLAGIASSARRAEVLKQSRLLAEIANDISTKRYEVGTIGSTELAQARTRLLQARLSALEAIIDYNIALADLARRTGYDFKARTTLTLPE
ncbi:MAG: TolC family protein [Bacteroidia bacterium]|nr:TolC family protein [Bacteroidia bacterium]